MPTQPPSPSTPRSAPTLGLPGLTLLRWLALVCLHTWALVAQAAPSAIPVYDYEVVRTYPHDPDAFTQGLLFQGGYLYESTGLHGRSSIRKVNLETGEVLLQKDLPPQYFGEGLTAWKKELYGLTWTSQVGFVFDLDTLALKRQFAYPGEGWGLAHDDRQLVLSDGSATLRMLNPVTMKELRRVQVTADGHPVDQLNELEWIGGEIFANLWHSDLIARIDPASGRVVGWVDLSGLLQSQGGATRSADVLNGIAYDARKQRLFVTGKLWPRLYEIKLVRRASRP